MEQCVYCNPILVDVYEHEFEIFRRVIRYESEHWSNYHDGYPIMELAKVNYCPMCGCKLKEVEQ